MERNANLELSAMLLGCQDRAQEAFHKAGGHDALTLALNHARGAS
jgi:hypothetical protein